MIPRFRTACLIVAGLYGLVGAGILLQGAAAAMEPYGVPAETLASPHYVDAINWVYLHTLVLAVVTGVVGWLAREPALKLWFARVMLGANLVYGALDFGHSDSPLGNALYKGDGSVVPGLMVVVILLLFLGPAIRREPGEGRETGP